MRLDFRLEKVDGAARAGRLTTLHGDVETPVFMPVGTQATVKGLTPDSLRAVGSRMILANTYHLLLRPGPEVFKKFGGIHRFMNWSGPVLTDSGGFQIFSLPHSRRIHEGGAEFQSYVDGRSHLLSPEESIAMQKAIGSDVMMVLDQCIPSTASWKEAEAAMELTHRWAGRSLNARGDSPAAMFAIVQGACFPDLRKRSVEHLCSLAFDGFAIGGLAVGETKAERQDFTALTCGCLPGGLPRYLMGVGKPIDILEAVHRGVDMFDCIIPSSLAKHGMAFTAEGRLQLRRAKYKFADEVLDASCDCVACAHYSRAYLHHLLKSDETLGWKLLSQHNLRFYHRLMKRIRISIVEGTFTDLYRREREPLMKTDNISEEMVL
jgi:queuine tRNA-ribosyltransferase